MTTDEEMNRLFAPAKKQGRSTRALNEWESLNETKGDAYAINLFDGKDVLKKLEIIKQQRDSQELQTCLRKMQVIGGQFFLVPQPMGYEGILMAC